MVFVILLGLSFFFRFRGISSECGILTGLNSSSGWPHNSIMSHFWIGYNCISIYFSLNSYSAMFLTSFCTYFFGLLKRFDLNWIERESVRGIGFVLLALLDHLIVSFISIHCTSQVQYVWRGSKERRVVESVASIKPLEVRPLVPKITLYKKFIVRGNVKRIRSIMFGHHITNENIINIMHYTVTLCPPQTLLLAKSLRRLFEPIK